VFSTFVRFLLLALLGGMVRGPCPVAGMLCARRPGVWDRGGQRCRRGVEGECDPVRHHAGRGL